MITICVGVSPNASIGFLWYNFWRSKAKWREGVISSHLITVCLGSCQRNLLVSPATLDHTTTTLSSKCFAMSNENEPISSAMAKWLYVCSRRWKHGLLSRVSPCYPCLPLFTTSSKEARKGRETVRCVIVVRAVTWLQPLSTLAETAKLIVIHSVDKISKFHADFRD